MSSKIFTQECVDVGVPDAKEEVVSVGQLCEYIVEILESYADGEGEIEPCFPRSIITELSEWSEGEKLDAMLEVYAKVASDIMTFVAMTKTAEL